MPIEKPLPLMVGNRAYYSLSSYDPVEITVEVPYASEEDVDLILEMTLGDLEGTPADLDDPVWVAAHFDGMSTRAQVREVIRQEIVAMNTGLAEEQKPGKCVEVLIDRLMQSVPPQHIEQARQVVQASFTEQMQAEGMTPQQFMARTGTTSAQLQSMFDQQARQMVEADAALTAWAHEKKIKAEDDELGQLLGIDPDDLPSVIEQARAIGQLDEMREAGTRSKALRYVVAECVCTYEHESPEKARARVAQYRVMQQMLGDQGDEGQGGEPSGSEHRTGFKLV